MRIPRWSVVLCSCSAATLMVSAAGAQEPIAAFVNVSVIPMDKERVLTQQTVLVQGDRVTALGPVDQVKVPAGARTIDGQGKFLLPGLADMHVHFGMQAPEDNYRNLFLFLANGVTTVRDMHSTREGGRKRDNPVLVLQAEVARGQRLGPQIYTAGDPDFSSPELAAKTTEELKGLTDFVKIADEELVSGAAYDSIAAAAARIKLKLVGHVPQERGLTVALRDRWASVEHTSGYREYLLGVKALMSGMNLFEVSDTVPWLQPGYKLDHAKLAEIAKATQQAGVWNCPTLQETIRFMHPPDPAEYELLHPGEEAPADALEGVLPEQMTSQEAVRRLEQMQRFKFEIVKALHGAGAGLLLGTDALDPNVAPVPGFSIHKELALLVEAGLTPYQALETGTRNVAEFLGALDSTGTVAVGKRADLLLLNGDPLHDISYTADLAGVLVGGHWLPRSELDARLDSLQTTLGGDGKVYDLKGVRQVMWRQPTTRQGR